MTLLALALSRRLTRRPHSTWCATASAWPTSQDDPLHCRGYVQERRRERLRDIAHDAEFQVRNACAPGFSRTRRGRDVQVEFWAEDPPMHKRLGFTADYTKST